MKQSYTSVNEVELYRSGNEVELYTSGNEVVLYTSGNECFERKTEQSPNVRYLKRQ